MASNISILPETDEATFCVQLTGIIEASEYAEKFDMPIQRMAASHDYFNVLVIYEENFEGWSQEAADLSFKNFSKYCPQARRIAYVNAPDSRRLMMKMMQPIAQGEVRYFESNQKAEAMAWVLEK